MPTATLKLTRFTVGDCWRSTLHFKNDSCIISRSQKFGREREAERSWNPSMKHDGKKLVKQSVGANVLNKNYKTKHIQSNIVLKQSGLSIRCFRAGWLHCHECKHTYSVIVRMPSTRCDEPTGRCFCAQCVQNAVLNIPTVFIMFFVEQGLFWPQYFIIFSTIM